MAKPVLATRTFLFDPDDVGRHLSALPHLRAALGDPLEEGEKSSAFSLARKSEREIYRVLGNTHYQNLSNLLQTLEFCLGRGYGNSTILRTSARKPFTDSLAELHAAEHFLLCGFEVEGQDDIRAQRSVPEFIARGHGINLAVEVYCPRLWEGIDALLEDLEDTAKNFDLPFDYSFEVRASARHQYAGKSMLLPHPSQLSDDLTLAIRARLVNDLRNALEAALHGSATSAFSWEGSTQHLTTSSVLSSIRASKERLPLRSGVVAGPTLSGYAPEGIFSWLVERNVKRKARKRQARGYAPWSLLLVDLSYSEMTSELRHPVYRRRFAEAIRNRLLPSLEHYDMIAFCDASGWRRKLRLHFFIGVESIPKNVPASIFENGTVLL